jgi:hypothetical protein
MEKVQQFAVQPDEWTGMEGNFLCSSGGHEGLKGAEGKAFESFFLLFFDLCNFHDEKV